MTYNISTTQRRVIENIENLVMCFDVYKGRWYEIKTDSRRELVGEKTVKSLLLHNVIAEAGTERVASGYRETRFALTEAGKLKLAKITPPKPSL